MKFEYESDRDKALLMEDWKRLMNNEKIVVGKYYANKLMKELIEGGFQFNVNWTGVNYQLEVA